jgi:hypothetical protein
MYGAGDSRGLVAMRTLSDEHESQVAWFTRRNEFRLQESFRMIATKEIALHIHFLHDRAPYSY